MWLVMRQLLPAVLVLMVVVGTVATGTPVGQPSTDAGTAPRVPTATTPVEPLPNTTGYLRFEDDRRETAGFGNATLDVGSAAVMDAGRLDDRLLATSAVRALERAENETARTRVLDRAAADLENRSAALERRQQRAVQRYNAGTLSTDGFLREMAIVDTRARQVSAAIDRLLVAADRQPGYSIPIDLRTRFESLQATPSVLRGPVRESAARAVTGEVTRTAIYAETASDGIVLARLSSSRYVREAFLSSEYGSGNDNQFTINAAYDRARTLYPWADENRITTPSADGYGNTAVYRITIDHAHGRLVSYIDGSTTNAFREVQEKRLTALPVTRTVSTDADDLSLRVNTTHGSGPMAVSVRDTETGEPVSARVTLDGQFVGETGPDGRLRTVQPSGTVVVNATADDGGSVEATVFDN